MAKYSEAQDDALKALDSPKVIQAYDDGSLDFEFEGQKLAMGPDGNVMTPAEYLKKVYHPWQKKQKKKKAEKPAPIITSYGYSSKTPCERQPEQCKPRVIKHVAFDADDTIWTIKPYGIASNITGKLTLLDPDTVVEERPSYKPSAKKKKTSAFQPTLPPYDEGLRFKYGYRYGSDLGYEEQPEDFFLQQIDKQSKPTSKTALEVDEIVTVLTEDLSEEEKDSLGLASQDVQILPKSATHPKKKPEVAPTSKFSDPQKTYIRLMPGYRDLLDTLKEQGVTSSIISLNTEGTVKRIIEAFGLTDNYLDIRDSWANKGKVFNEQMKEFGYKPKEGIFIDDSLGHVEDVAKSGAIALQIGHDVKEIAQIVSYMTNA